MSARDENAHARIAVLRHDLEMLEARHRTLVNDLRVLVWVFIAVQILAYCAR